MQLVEISDRAHWDAFVDTHPFGHPLQLWGWGETKRQNNWTPHRLALIEGDVWVAAAQALLWPIPRTGRKLAYVPRGPVTDPTGVGVAALLEALAAWSRERGALYARIEPAWIDAGLPRGWMRATRALQMRETYTLDLSKTEADLLEPMSRKHRQYIRKSERDGVTVELLAGDASELRPIHDIYTLTAQRAGFGIHTERYYSQLYEQLNGYCHVYNAIFEGRPVAFLWLAAAGGTAYELYGGVDDVGRELKANYLLKWRAITDMKANGCRVYDFNGRLNEGVARFKEGFGPEETDYIGTWDFPLNKPGYHLWERLWPIAAPVARRLLTKSHTPLPSAD